MDALPLVATVVAFALVVGSLRYLSRPHTVVRVHAGRATLIRGAPPSGLLGELDALARAAPAASGRVELTSGGHQVKLGTPGLAPPIAQRVRNVVFDYREKIR